MERCSMPGWQRTRRGCDNLDNPPSVLGWPDRTRFSFCPPKSGARQPAQLLDLAAQPTADHTTDFAPTATRPPARVLKSARQLSSPAHTGLRPGRKYSPAVALAPSGGVFPAQG